MPHNTPATFGIYPTRAAAEAAIGQLKKEGFKGSEISIIMPHKHVRKEEHVPNTNAVEGAEAGAGVGIIIGGVLGFLAETGMLTIPAIAVAVMGGPLTATILAMGTMAGIGGLWGALVGLCIPEKETRHFHGRLHSGDILMAVHCTEPERMMRAKEIMIHTGTEDIYSQHKSAMPWHRNLAAASGQS